MDISIIIVNWNTKEYLDKCISSIYANLPKVKFDIWVVDNASSDGSVRMLEKKYPKVKLIKNEQNVGFAKANNQAILESDTRYIWLLNSDTEIKSGALDHLYEFMESNTKVGAAGSMLLNPDGTLQVSCYPLPTLKRELWRLLHLDKIYPYGIYNMDTWNLVQPREAGVVQGASMFLRRKALDQVGVLDGDYFMYTEEVDLCFRFHKGDWKIFWIPQSQVVHYGGQSTQQVAAKMFLSLYQTKLMYFRKNHGQLASTTFKLILFSISFIRIALSPLTLFMKPDEKEHYSRLAKNYIQLIRHLPKM